MSVHGSGHYSKDQLNQPLPEPAGVLKSHLDKAEKVPLRLDEYGAVRFENSRICVDLVIDQFENGMTPEAIAAAYDGLQLAEIYAVISFYLRHKTEFQEYLEHRRQEANTLRAEIEASRPRLTREELIARRCSPEDKHAAAGM